MCVQIFLECWRCALCYKCSLISYQISTTVQKTVEGLCDEVTYVITVCRKTVEGLCDEVTYVITVCSNYSGLSQLRREGL